MTSPSGAADPGAQIVRGRRKGQRYFRRQLVNGGAGAGGIGAEAADDQRNGWLTLGVGEGARIAGERRIIGDTGADLDHF